MCTKFLGVSADEIEEFLFFYVEVNGVWYRFYLNHGILFWANYAPDREDDLGQEEDYLGEEEDYVDILPQREGKSFRVKAIEMNAERLVFSWLNGQEVVIEQSEDLVACKVRIECPPNH